MLPGADPVTALRRRRSMVPLTGARIRYIIGDETRETRETRIETVIVNRAHVEWLEAVEPDRSEFPAGPHRLAPDQA